MSYSCIQYLKTVCRVKRKSTTLKSIIWIGRVLFPVYELHLFIIFRQTTVSIIMRHLKAMQRVIGYRAMLVKVSTPLIWSPKTKGWVKKIAMGVPCMPSVNLLQLHCDCSDTSYLCVHHWCFSVRCSRVDIKIKLRSLESLLHLTWRPSRTR